MFTTTTLHIRGGETSGEPVGNSGETVGERWGNGGGRGGEGEHTNLE